MNNDLPISLLKDPRCLLAFGFGSGYSAKAPGTIGTLTAIPFYLLLSHLDNFSYLVVCATAFVIGCYICEIASKKLGVEDHGGVVWDEYVGYWIAMYGAPAGCEWVIIGFVLFRIFDIFKPWPIKVMDKNIKGGIGIMIDDVVAGLFALCAMSLISNLI
ncbi:phosphatidylglycerophosphatase [Oleiphilus sp. HI0009]|nr:phosphatidylglycerophosphatase [Oleiphilus sp. HI0009]